MKNSFFFSAGGIAPSPDSSPGEKGYPRPTSYPYQAFWIHPASPRIPARFMPLAPSQKHSSSQNLLKVKGKGFPYSLPSVGPGADPSVQAVSPQMTISHPPSRRLPLLSARPVATLPSAEHHRHSAGTKLYCLVTEAHRCEQLAQGCYAAFAPSRI